MKNLRNKAPKLLEQTLRFFRKWRERGNPSQDSPQTTYCPSSSQINSQSLNCRETNGHRCAISDLSCFPNLYSQRTNIQTKVINIESFCKEQNEFILKLDMITIENQVTNVEKELKELENSYANVNISNRKINEEKCNEESFPHFVTVAARIRQAAKLIEENAGAICLEEPQVLNICERIGTLLKNARKIKLILNQQGIAKLKLGSIEQVVDSLNYLINVIEDTLEIDSINNSIDSARNKPATKEEEEFIESILRETEDIHRYKIL